MINTALNTLRHRSQRLSERQKAGTSLEVNAARELMRRSLVELYELGHWQDHPEQLRDYMDIYRASDSGVDFTVTASMSAPDRRAQCSP